jgi:hypothetical protein
MSKSNHCSLDGKAFFGRRAPDTLTLSRRRFSMGLFKSDLLRSFGLGFALGTVLLVGSVWAQSDDGLTGKVIPKAEAAPLPDRTR